MAHQVLDARPEHAEREAEIVAQAGQPGKVTIATNMAGRGTDILIGGNPEFMAKQESLKKGIAQPAVDGNREPGMPGYCAFVDPYHLCQLKPCARGSKRSYTCP